MEDRLRKFATIVDAGSFTAAASQLHISQPALTTAVQKLERELKAELLVRKRQGFTLSPAGKIAYDAAKALDVHATNLRRSLADLQAQKTPFTIGAIDAVADLLFVRGTYLQQLQQAAELSLSIDNSSQILRLLEHDDIELALIAKPATPLKTFTTVPLGHEPLVLVSSPERSLDAIDDITRGHINDFLAYNQRSRTYELVANHFLRQHMRLSPTFYSTSPHILLQLTLAGRGIAVLPYLLVEPAIQAGTLVLLHAGKEPYIARDIIAVHRPGKLLHTEANGLLTHAKAQLAALANQVNKLQEEAGRLPEK